MGCSFLNGQVEAFIITIQLYSHGVLVPLASVRWLTFPAG
jgi:hypothetical protein